ncbi:MAG: hypothetical protein WBV69_19635 [Candidatus Sulfotelmatobacter sp.]
MNKEAQSQMINHDVSNAKNVILLERERIFMGRLRRYREPENASSKNFAILACEVQSPKPIPIASAVRTISVVRGRGGVNFVDRVADGMQRGVEAKRYLCCGKIIVDGLGHTYDFHTLLDSSKPIFCEPSPPMVMIASIPSLAAFAMTRPEISRCTSLPCSTLS